MCIYPSYTYLIGWSNLNLWYYGVRLGNKCMPSQDLWHKYFTSSTLVKKYRIKFGEPDVVQIRKTFESNLKASTWETKVLKRLQVLKNEKWLNRSISGAILPMRGYCHPRFGDVTSQDVKEKISQKIKERGGHKGIKNPMYGVTHSNESREIMSKNRKGLTANEKNPMFNKKHSCDTKLKMSYKIKEKGGHNSIRNPMYGKTHTEETRKKLSEINKGEKSNNFIGYYITPWGKFSSSKEAAQKAPAKISSWTINRWCRKDNEKIVTKSGISKSKILCKHNEGESFKEIGFSFEVFYPPSIA